MQYIKKVAMKAFIIIAIAIIGIGCHSSDETLSVDQYIANGRRFNADGKVDEAIESFKKAIKLKPETSDLHFELGVIFYEGWRKSFETAQQHALADVIKGRRDSNIPNNDKLLIEYGYRKEFYSLALLEFSEALKYEPSNWKARYFIATDLFNNKKYEQAIVEFTKIIQLEPNYANNYTILGEAYLKTGQYQLAINTLEKASDMDVAAYHYYVLGLAYKKVNNRKKVDKMATKLKEMKSDYYRLLNPEN